MSGADLNAATIRGDRAAVSKLLAAGISPDYADHRARARPPTLAVSAGGTHLRALQGATGIRTYLDKDNTSAGQYGRSARGGHP